MPSLDAVSPLLQQARSKARLLVDVPREFVALLPGWAQYLATGRTSFRAYRSMRRLHYMTDGLFNEAVHGVIKRLRPPVALDSTDGVLGDMRGPALDSALQALDRDGYYVFERRLPVDVVEEIRAFALRTACHPNGEGFSPDPVFFDETRQQAPTMHFASNDLLRCAPLRKLMVDRSILALGQAQLKSSVIMDTPRMWWSTAGAQASSAAAQLFHVDMDRLRWLNFFFLITDVDADNGPHCFVRGSHRGKPTALHRDGRFADDEVERHYPNQTVELGGPRGTIFVVDTRGLHKGKVLHRGNRLMFQILLADSLFGQTYENVTVPPDLRPDFEDVWRKFPSIYSAFVPAHAERGATT